MTGWVRNRVNRVSRWAGQHWLISAVSLVMLLGGVVACESTNTYPLDFFMEMHYQKSFRTLEPPRPESPQGIVPIEGRAPLYNQQQASGLENRCRCTPAGRSYPATSRRCPRRLYLHGGRSRLWAVHAAVRQLDSRRRHLGAGALHPHPAAAVAPDVAIATPSISRYDASISTCMARQS